MRRTRLAYLALSFAAFLFGSTFVVVKQAVESLPPLSFVGWRFLVGSAVLVVLAPPRGWRLWRDGLLAGGLLFAGYATQTLGLAHTSASNSGLITGLYVVFTPLLAAAVARRAPHLLVVAGAALAFGGLALLTLEHGLSLQSGDLLTLACAVSYAGHIIFLSRVAARHRVIPFTAVQLLVTAAGGMAFSAAFEGLRFPAAGVWPALLLTGLAVSAGAFLIQVWTQTVIGPSRTAIILALEPAFAAAMAALMLGERFTLRGWIGAGLILAGIYVTLAGEDEPLPAAEALTPAH
jgi:drug/metabolite transporter (DMT)-like permease